MLDPAAQLTLDLFAAAEANFGEYQPGSNLEVVNALINWAAGAGPPVIYLWGGSATGKTHLLQAAIRKASATGARAMYIPLRALSEYGPKVLEGLESVDVVAIDDLDVARNDADWEHCLFNLYNALSASAGRLLWASRLSAASGIFTLQDLASRLAASLVYQLHELSDSEKALALASIAARRGLTVPSAVVAFILRRQRRDMAALSELLDRLDHASLRDGRAITIPFVREVLAR